MKRLAVLLVTLVGGLAAGVPAQVGAQASASEGAPFLLLPIGSRSVGLARAMTATTGSESVWWNPAGLAGLEDSRIDIFRGEDLAGESTSLSGLIARPALGTLGLSYLLSDLGTVDLRDDQGTYLGEISYRNHIGVLSAASEPIPLLAVGLNFKVIQSRFTCRGECVDGGVTATTWAIDAGVQLRRFLGLPITLGGALVHAGGDLQVFNADQADPLPTRIRVAAAWSPLEHWIETDELDAILLLEFEDRWEDPGSPATYVGAEFSAGVEQAIYVRAGYAFGAELQVDGAGVGVGVRYDRFDLGIAKSLASSSLIASSDPVQISFGFIL